MNKKMKNLKPNIIKLTPEDKKSLRLEKTNYLITYANGTKGRGFRTLEDLNKFLGYTGRLKLKVSSFKR